MSGSILTIRRKGHRSAERTASAKSAAVDARLLDFVRLLARRAAERDYKSRLEGIKKKATREKRDS
jgi:hypothetical protein